MVKVESDIVNENQTRLRTCDFYVIGRFKGILKFLNFSITNVPNPFTASNYFGSLSRLILAV